MKRIDKLFTEGPEMGVGRMHQEISTPDNPVNIKRVHRLMRLMGLEAVYQKPNRSGGPVVQACRRPSNLSLFVARSGD